jgi:aminoglycoside phosphotransferase family enzyme
MGEHAARESLPDGDPGGAICLSRDIPLEAKVAFLETPAAYGCASGAVGCRETHMSWVFATANEVYKLKKPVRFSYLDFSSLERRRKACAAELELNRRLAPDVYKSLVPLTWRAGGMAIGGGGDVIDWLVVMRRLDESRTLERLLLSRRLAPWQLNPLIALLTRFYRRTPRVTVSPAAHLERWRRSLAANRPVLLDPRLGLPATLVRRIDRRQREFLQHRSGLLMARVRGRMIVDGHGDLRPEHIWPEPPVTIIDCLEFDAELRAIDPLDELAFLHVECSLLGFARHAAHVVRRVAGSLPGGFEPELFDFYCSYRAMLRARLAIAHLLEERPRSPEKWRPLALRYLLAADRAWQTGGGTMRA